LPFHDKKKIKKNALELIESTFVKKNEFKWADLEELKK
jgi:hypothetical protein